MIGEGPGGAGEDAARDRHAGRAGGQDGELVAAEPRDRVHQAHRLGEGRGDLAQDVIGHVRPALAIDRRQAVDVEDGQADRRALAARPHQLELEHALERAAIGEPGEGIRAGQAFEPVGAFHEGLFEARLADHGRGQVAHGAQGGEGSRRVAGVGREAGGQEAFHLLGPVGRLGHEGHVGQGLDRPARRRQVGRHGRRDGDHGRMTGPHRPSDRVVVPAIAHGQGLERGDGARAEAPGAAGEELRRIPVEEVDHGGRRAGRLRRLLGQPVQPHPQVATARHETAALGQHGEEVTGGCGHVRIVPRRATALGSTATSRGLYSGGEAGHGHRPRR